MTSTDAAGPAVEQVVLLDEDGHPIGVQDKATVHHGETPLHLAFSCYAFTDDGSVLVTRRALHKRTFPGVWTNSFCGHPGPGESFESAVRRRGRFEVGLEARAIEVALPDFRYTAEMDGVRENELCPVYLARYSGEVSPDPDEVESTRTMSWAGFVDRALNDPGYSPWARLQVRRLVEADCVTAYLARSAAS